MQNISSVAELKYAIQLLEVDQANKEQLLREQFCYTYESLKPINIIKNTIKDISSSPYLIENMVGSAIGLGTGFLSKKLIVGASGNIVRRIIGGIVEFGVTNLVSHQTSNLKSTGLSILQHIFKKKKHPEVNN